MRGRGAAVQDMFRAALIVGIVSFSLTVPAAAGPYDDASDAYDRGDYATALRLWRPLADQGEAEAQFLLGVMYGNGHGVAQDFVLAHSVKCDYGTKGVPVLRIPNVSGGRISLDDIKFGQLSQTEVADLSLREGDLLLIRSNGSLEIVGRAAVVTPDAVGMSFAGYLVRFRTASTVIDPNYIWLAMNSSEVREQIERPIRSAVGLKNVNLTEFGALAFRLPPLAEQRRIVAKVNELMALCDRLEAGLANASDIRRRLLDALLTKALAPAQMRELEAAE